MKQRNDKQDIRNYNFTKKEYHGYQQWYSSEGKLQLRTIAKNSLAIGYSEDHQGNNTSYFIL